jgi:hypothetical protein
MGRGGGGGWGGTRKIIKHEHEQKKKKKNKKFNQDKTKQKNRKYTTITSVTGISERSATDYIHPTRKGIPALSLSASQRKLILPLG